MKVIGYTFTYNDEQLVPFVLPYIEAFGYDKFVVYDNGSTDKTVELLSACPIIEIRHYDTNGKFDDAAKCFKEREAYKECLEMANIGTNDEEQVWISLLDFDEVLCINSNITIKRILEKRNLYGYNCFFKRMINLFPPKGHEEGWISNNVKPNQLVHCVDGMRGSYWTGGGMKPVLFLVNDFREMVILSGNHYALLKKSELNKTPNPINETCEIYSFHLKYLDRGFCRERWEKYKDREGNINYTRYLEDVDSEYDRMIGFSFPLENYFMVDGLLSKECRNGEFWEGIKFLNA